MSASRRKTSFGMSGPSCQIPDLRFSTPSMTARQIPKQVDFTSPKKCATEHHPNVSNSIQQTPCCSAAAMAAAPGLRPNSILGNVGQFDYGFKLRSVTKLPFRNTTCFQPISLHSASFVRSGSLPSSSNRHYSISNFTMGETLYAICSWKLRHRY